MRLKLQTHVSHFRYLLHHICDCLVTHVLAALEHIDHGYCGAHRCGVHPDTSVYSHDTLELEVLTELGGHVTRRRQQPGDARRSLIIQCLGVGSGVTRACISLPSTQSE